MRNEFRLASLGALLLGAGCAATVEPTNRRPAEEYASRVKLDYARRDPEYAAKLRREQGFASAAAPLGHGAAFQDPARAQFRMVSDDVPPELDPRVLRNPPLESGVVTNLGGDVAAEGYQVHANPRPYTRDYTGPLNLGDPGVSSSLWKESRGANDLFRDYRAFQPMDLITIVVNESTNAKKEGTTDVKQESSFSAAIRNLLGIEDWSKLNIFDSSTAGSVQNGADLSNLVRASMSSDFKGEGSTERKGNLKGKISAMVAEVLPSGILRIEGEKIIALNSEEETMVISGLVRPEDINSANEVDSSKVGNVRIDYFGEGTIGDAQRGGWVGRIFRRWWPF
jgi:flagellar L-ring protein precursor FlgH